MIAIGLFLIGLALSAFFSGSETGLYRVSRTRLVLDGLDGSWSARWIVWLLNHPAIFVATTLVGNNVANYLTSVAVVIAVQQWFTANPAAELIGPMLMTPIVFVFGELLPKYLFFHAPYRLLMATKPILIAATCLFAPVSWMLGLLGGLLQRVTGQLPFQLRLAMARRELDQVLRAGHEAGLLAESQRNLAAKLFEVGNLSAATFGRSPDRIPQVTTPIDVPAAAKLAQRLNESIVLVKEGKEWLGYLRFIDLVCDEGPPRVLPLVRGTVSDSHLKTLVRLNDQASGVAILLDSRGNAKSIVTRRQLLAHLIS
ncbi:MULTISPECIES: CNNM domain-containing protein [Crateriforma]|uniref:CNNM transmembrane domain-containing protein n=1 Tax=Crateriforma conspicua TaxID=2527996 RepID=A0A5C6FVT8_9PLAN|nr:MULTISPECIES: DUF21 domain-containing protein [Crateriforma]TWU65153.1 hypothetical protein V7x_06990 [Crateriforma conspicua]